MYTYVTISSQESLPCSFCKCPFQDGQLHVSSLRSRSKFTPFHLFCYQPTYFAPIRIEELAVVKVTDSAKRETIGKWVENWNKLFEIDEERVESQYVTKGISTIETPFRRLFLSIYEYLSILDIESTVAYVCKSWYHMSKDPEHWKARFIADFHPSQTDSSSNYLRKYIAYVRNSCWNCCKLISLGDIKRKCRRNGQPLCIPCSRLRECRVVTLNSFCREKEVTRAVLDRLKVPFFEYYSGKACYLMVIVEKLLPHAEYRRKLLLSALKTHSLQLVTDQEMQIIAEFDLESFYKQEEKSILCPLVRTLAGFCGKNGVREQFARSVNSFITAITSARSN